jgi:predicted nucleotidyltransferase
MSQKIQKDGIEDIKKKIIPVLRHFRVKRAGPFGSAARGELRADSDIDILIELEDDLSPLDFVRIKQKIEETHSTVRLTSQYSTLKPLLKDQILKEQVTIILK